MKFALGALVIGCKLKEMRERVRRGTSRALERRFGAADAENEQTMSRALRCMDVAQ